MTLVAGAAFTWLGMVLGISFLEAPLKFRAPGITVPLGLGIGRLVFTALNRVEVLLGAVVAAGLVIGPHLALAVGIAAVLAVVLAVQLGAVRPVLNRRSDLVLAGEDVPRGRAHVIYIGLEVLKVCLLLTLGIVAVAH
jgi:hypothetical protein